MNYNLVKENNEILRKVAEPWDFSTDGDVNDLTKNMMKTMMENNGIGLAAPQIGLSKRIFVMGNSSKLYACVNPQIISGVGEIKDIEGCLSFPHLWLRIKRFETINVTYQNVLGEEVITEFSGLIARVFQHELEHLDGICFDTKVGKLSLEMAKNKRKKQKIKASSLLE